MIYLFFKDENQDVQEIEHYHFMPFDEEYGLGKTEEELRATGLLVESLPEAQTPAGKTAVLYANKATGEVWYEYVDAPVEPQPLEDQVKLLEAQNTELMLALAVMAESYEQEKTEMQIAIAELAELVAGGN